MDSIGAREIGATEYFRTESRYARLAARILADLETRRGFILLLSDPPASLLHLSQALSRGVEGRATVVGIASGPDLTYERLMPATAASRTGRTSPLFILENADRLSDKQIEEIQAASLRGDRVYGFVLTALPAFLQRLNRPSLAFLKDSLVARYQFQQMNGDEVELFIRRHQSAGAPTVVDEAASLESVAQRLLDATAEITDKPAMPLVRPAARGLADALHDREKAAAAPVVKPLVPPEPEPAEAGREIYYPPVARGKARRVAFSVFFGLAYMGVVAGAGLLIFRMVHPGVETSPRLAVIAPDGAARSDSTTAEAPVTHPEEAQAPTPELAEKANKLAPTAAPTSEAPPPPSRSTAAPPAAVEAPARTDAPPAGAETLTGLAAPSPAEALPPSEAPAHIAAATPVGEAPQITPGPAASPSTGPAPAPAAVETPPEVSAPAAAPPQAASGAAPLPASKPPAPAKVAALPDRPEPAAKPAPAESSPAPAVSLEIRQLRARGDELLGRGDIISARLFYERAADAGDAQAALKAGATYDPAFLEQWGVRGVRGDLVQAASWYRRARELGAQEAERLLESLPKP